MLPEPVLLSLDVTSRAGKCNLLFQHTLVGETGRAEDTAMRAGQGTVSELWVQSYLKKSIYLFLQDPMHPCCHVLPTHRATRWCHATIRALWGFSGYCNDFLVPKFQPITRSCCFLGSFVQKCRLFRALHHTYVA